MHQDDLLNGCVDERQYHRFEDARAEAGRAMAAQERVELRLGSGKGETRTRLGTALPSLSGGTNTLLSIEQRRDIWER